ARPHELEPGAVDDHRVGLFQILDRAQHQARRNTGQCRIIDAEQDDLLQHSVPCMRNRQPLEEGDGPIDAIDAAHPPELHVGHGLDLIDILDARIHDPDVRFAGIEDLARGAQHQPGEDRDLVRHQHRRERDDKEQTDILASIAEEDYEYNTTQPSLQRYLRGAAAPRLFLTGHRHPLCLEASGSITHNVYSVIMA